MGGDPDDVPWGPPGTDPGGAPEILVFRAEACAVVRGRSTRLTWRVIGARAVHVDNGVGKVDGNGSCEVRPLATTEYTLTAHGAEGPRVRARMVVHVVPLPRLPRFVLRGPVCLRTVAVVAPRVDAVVRVPLPPARPMAPVLPVLPPLAPVRVCLDVSVRVEVASAVPVALRPSLRDPPVASAGHGLHPSWLSRVGDVFARVRPHLDFTAVPGEHP